MFNFFISGKPKENAGQVTSPSTDTQPWVMLILLIALEMTTNLVENLIGIAWEGFHDV